MADDNKKRERTDVLDAEEAPLKKQCKAWGGFVASLVSADDFDPSKPLSSDVLQQGWANVRLLQDCKTAGDLVEVAMKRISFHPSTWVDAMNSPLLDAIRLVVETCDGAELEKFIFRIEEEYSEFHMRQYRYMRFIVTVIFKGQELLLDYLLSLGCNLEELKPLVFNAAVRGSSGTMVEKLMAMFPTWKWGLREFEPMDTYAAHVIKHPAVLEVLFRGKPDNELYPFIFDLSYAREPTAALMAFLFQRYKIPSNRYSNQELRDVIFSAEAKELPLKFINSVVWQANVAEDVEYLKRLYELGATEVELSCAPMTHEIYRFFKQLPGFKLVGDEPFQELPNECFSRPGSYDFMRELIDDKVIVPSIELLHDVFYWYHADQNKEFSEAVQLLELLVKHGVRPDDQFNDAHTPSRYDKLRAALNEIIERCT